MSRAILEIQAYDSLDAAKSNIKNLQRIIDCDDEDYSLLVKKEDGKF